MEDNLANSIDGFSKIKRQELIAIGEDMVSWRKGVHP